MKTILKCKNKIWIKALCDSIEKLYFSLNNLRNVHKIFYLLFNFLIESIESTIIHEVSFEYCLRDYLNYIYYLKNIALKFYKENIDKHLRY